MPEVNRTIVNFGVLELTDEMRECQSFSLYTQVERFDLNRSQNFKRSRPQSFYGYGQVLERGYVLHEFAISFENELSFHWENGEIVLLRAIECAVDAFQVPIEGIATAVGAVYLPSPPTQVPVKRMPGTDIVFKLFGKTTLYLRAIYRVPPPLCNGEYDWQEREQPAAGALTKRTPLNPPSIPVNAADPNGYDLADPPYDGLNDQGDTYAPERPVCDGCTFTLVWSNLSIGRFPGGPLPPNPNLSVSYPGEQCPISVEARPDDGAASFPKDADYVVRDKNGNILDIFTSYVYNPATPSIDNADCV